MKLWGGRFADRKPDPQGAAQFEKFSESFSFDQRLILYDLGVNTAYVEELGRAGAVRAQEVRRLLGATSLDENAAEVAEGKRTLRPLGPEHALADAANKLFCVYKTFANIDFGT